MKNPQQVLSAYEPDLPNRASSYFTLLLMMIFGLFRPARFRYLFDKKDIRGRAFW